ncbi:hypothetical protein C4552_02370 [Candidatus Parcubacteria bacterium]|nr:MAG: hypothetical protein C4552_02370 [Candidatus Parcubacteria bacterium]
MNLAAYGILLLIGLLMWWRSGVRPFERFMLLGFAVLAVMWWGVWGQVAVADGWWIYHERNIMLGRIGVIPVADALYFSLASAGVSTSVVG